MLGLLLLYFIGKQYAKLAKQYGKKKWVWVVMGIVAYYAGSFLAAFLIVIIYEVVLEENSDYLSETALNLMSIPLGLIACWGLYAGLKKAWSKKKVELSHEVLDSDIIDTPHEEITPEPSTVTESTETQG